MTIEQWRNDYALNAARTRMCHIPNYSEGEQRRADRLTRVLTLIEAAKAMDAHLRHLAMHGLANQKPDLYIVSDLATALADLETHGDIAPTSTDTGRSADPDGHRTRTTGPEPSSPP